MLRHAAIDTQSRAIGWFDCELSTEGKRTLEVFASRWNEPAAAIHCSDLQRAKLTAAAIATGCGIPMQVSAIWRELHLGAAEGERWDDLHDQHTQAMADWGTHWVHQGLLGGESFLALMQRAVRGLESLPTDQSAVLVSHAGMIKAVLALHHGWSAEQAMAHEVPYLSVHRIRLPNTPQQLWLMWQQKHCARRGGENAE